MPARLRSVLALVVLVVACIAAPVATTAWWTRATVTDTDRFVETLAPLATEPEVTELAERRLVNQVMARVDAAQPLKRAAQALQTTDLPPAVAAVIPMLAEPLREQTVSIVERIVHRIVSSPHFVEAWELSLTDVHEQAISVLEGDTGDLVDTSDEGTVSLSLATLAETVSLALEDAGIPGASRLADVNVVIPVATVENLASAQSGYSLLRSVGRWLPIGVVVFLVAGVALAHRRIRATRGAAFGVAAALIIGLFAIAVGRHLGVSALPDDGQDAATAMFGILTSSLRGMIRALVILALLIAAATFFLGDAPATVQRRRAVSQRYSSLLTWARATPWAWPVAAALGAVAFLILLLIDLGPVLMVVFLAVAIVTGGFAYVARPRSESTHGTTTSE